MSSHTQTIAVEERFLCKLNTWENRINNATVEYSLWEGRKFIIIIQEKEFRFSLNELLAKVAIWSEEFLHILNDKEIEMNNQSISYTSACNIYNARGKLALFNNTIRRKSDFYTTPQSFCQKINYFVCYALRIVTFVIRSYHTNQINVINQKLEIPFLKLTLNKTAYELRALNLEKENKIQNFKNFILKNQELNEIFNTSAKKTENILLPPPVPPILSNTEDNPLIKAWQIEEYKSCYLDSQITRIKDFLDKNTEFKEALKENLSQMQLTNYLLG